MCGYRTEDDICCGMVEMEMRELLSFYNFDGDNTPVIRGSALGGLNGDPQFRDLKSQWRDNEETFNLTNGTIQRKELGEPARFRYLINNLNFRYNYYKNDRMFDVVLAGEITNFPNNDFKSKLITNTSTDTLLMTDNSRNTAFTPRLRLYYQEPLGENQMLYISLSGNYNNRNYKRDYQEVLNNNTVENYFYSDVDEKQQAYNLSASYENNIS